MCKKKNKKKKPRRNRNPFEGDPQGDEREKNRIKNKKIKKKCIPFLRIDVIALPPQAINLKSSKKGKNC